MDDGDLLVVARRTDRAPAAMAMDFDRATVVHDPAKITGSYDIIMLEPAYDDGAWLAEAIRGAIPAMRPDGRIALLLDGAGDDPLPVDGLAWVGIEAVPGGPAAILRRGNDSALGDLLRTALLSARLAGEESWRRATAVCEQRAAVSLMRHEEALRGQIDALAAKVSDVEKNHRGAALWKTVAVRSRPGRALRPFIGRLRRRFSR